MWRVKKDLTQLYDRASRQAGEAPFASVVLELLGAKYSMEPRELDKIPPDGPVVLVANHPLGGLEGLVLLDILQRRRSDARVLANGFLGSLSHLKNRFILVDPMATKASAKANVKPLAQALRWLQRGGLLGLFPAGEVAHLRWRRLQVEESEWLPTAVWLARKAKAPILPLYFNGTNDWLFHVAGLLSPRLRTAMLPRQLLRSKGAVLHPRFGKLIEYGELVSMGQDHLAAKELRRRTLSLAHLAAEVVPSPFKALSTL